MELTGTYKLLCNLLIIAFNKKFQYEKESSIYNVVSILNVSKFKNWLLRADCQDFRRVGLENIAQVATSFLKPKPQSTQNLNESVSSNVSSVSTSTSCDSYCISK